jgi:hypothetical protein
LAARVLAWAIGDVISFCFFTLILVRLILFSKSARAGKRAFQTQRPEIPTGLPALQVRWDETGWFCDETG